MIDKEKLKYSFMIIPFKINGNKMFSGKLNSDFFIEVDSKEKKYQKLYKHIENAINSVNKNRYISEYVVNRKKYFKHYDNYLEFNTINKCNNNSFKTLGYVDNISCYVFNDSLGFIIYNYIFDNSVDFDSYCDIINLLKKIDRVETGKCLEIKSGALTINLREELDYIAKQFGGDVELFFQHNSDKYVSATMLNSFCFDEIIDEKTVVRSLECLKKSKSKDFHVLELKEHDYLNPFEGIYWGFSTQGIGNINYCVDNSIKSFIYTFYDRVKKEYLLMMLLLLNQEYTLMDFCICFSEDFYVKSSFNKKTVIENSNRLYRFKILNTYTIVSHLDHYRQFYKMYYNVLNIDELMKEVTDKQDAIYATYNNNKLKKKSYFEFVLTILIALMPVVLVIPDLIVHLNSENKGVFLGTIISIGVYFIIGIVVSVVGLFKKD